MEQNLTMIKLYQSILTILSDRENKVELRPLLELPDTAFKIIAVVSAKSVQTLVTVVLKYRKI